MQAEIIYKVGFFSEGTLKVMMQKRRFIPFFLLQFAIDLVKVFFFMFPKCLQSNLTWYILVTVGNPEESYDFRFTGNSICMLNAAKLLACVRFYCTCIALYHV